MTDFYFCPICGNLMIKLEDSSITPSCCGREMKILAPASKDGSVEKHVPVLDITSLCNDGIKKITVRIGESPHPMEATHFIQFIALETSNGIYVTKLKATDPPEAIFYLSYGEHYKRAYCYCNIHGLWEK